MDSLAVAQRAPAFLVVHDVGEVVLAVVDVVQGGDDQSSTADVVVEAMVRLGRFFQLYTQLL